MSAPRRTIPDVVREAQARASHPDTSVFVAANAGSGKTHVLVNRVIRLLLQDVPPGRILCITFTKAAAANMSERVFAKLGQWVRLSDEDLNRQIRDAGEPNPTAETRRRARGLFASALETPGGLKVQTIHALCTRLLQQFPFESKVPAHFAVLDERDQNDMMERANLSVLMDAASAPDSAAGRALQTSMATAADQTFSDVVHEACVTNRHFLAWTDAADGLETARAQVMAALGVKSDERADDVARLMVDGPHLPIVEWLAIAGILDGGSKTDAAQAARLREAHDASGEEQIASYLGVFMTDAGTMRKSLMTKGLADEHPGLAARLASEQARVEGLRERLRAIAQRDRTIALLEIARAVSSHYRREKRERGLLDYEDLIDKTLALLSDGRARWVHFKLDRGIDHVLIDEAQDTSPKQWDIVTKLIEEFWSGESARDGMKRTVFAVGDEKQSIFSFQGAAPREFDLRRTEFERMFRQAKLGFEKVLFKHSFRSGKAILDAVDHVFRDEAIYKSIHQDTAYPVHEALTDAPPALIDLWPLEQPSDSDSAIGWAAPLDATSEASPEARLAQRVRAEIDALMAAKTMTGSADERRRLRHGDILILVRRRGAAFEAVIQALKQAGIPVAGADRLKLTEHIAVIDLMNLADALLFRHDDLALAVALKSPLFGLDDDDLLKFAPSRKGSLRTALVEYAAHDPRLRKAWERLEAYESRVRHETPFGFFAWLLGGDGGRARILKRLGLEANDAIDEFLELALSYERKAPASLQGFMAWLRAAETEVKRDMEILRDEVRVMTVHGAKGLEASVVFMIDTTTSPTDTQRQNLIALPQGNAGPHAPNVVVWAGKSADDPANVATARTRMKEESEDEYRRLLYVAMTRAADRLLVGGILPGNRKNLRENSWYDLIAKGLAASGLTAEDIETGSGKLTRYHRAADVEPAAPDEVEAQDAEQKELPAWLRDSVQPETSAAILMRPSDSADDGHRVVTGESQAARAKALQRGTLIHRLLQSLPDIASTRRAETAKNFLARNANDADGWNDSERSQIVMQVLALLDDKTFAPLFAPGSRAEVSIAGYVERHGRRTVVSGQIDRLVVTPKEVLIVDYKTSHAPPSTEQGVPRDYVRQLALYRDVLSRIHPDKPVRCVLLWTETAALMEIQPDTLTAGLQRALA